MQSPSHSINDDVEKHQQTWLGVKVTRKVGLVLSSKEQDGAHGSLRWAWAGLGIFLSVD